jgi:hypothetical protein
MKGISSLSRISGKEHEQVSRILMGLIIGQEVGSGCSAVQVVQSVRGILDFLFLAQYLVHTDQTLDCTLQQFHENKAIFVELGIRSNFNLPKLHFAKHYTLKIKFFGTADNFNTEYTERLHIDLAKNAYHATNHKDEFTQMTTWLEHKEKIQRHNQFINLCLNHTASPSTIPHDEWITPGLSINRTLHLSRHLSAHRVTMEDIVSKYGAFYFREALSRFVMLAHCPQLTAAQLEHAIWGVQMPVCNIWVWHLIKFRSIDPFTLSTMTVDSAHTNPTSERFDTVLIQTASDEESNGIHSMLLSALLDMIHY